MAKYKAYPEYKNSGVEWLGEMPCHWNLQKAKYIFRKIQRATTEQDGIVTAFRDGQVTLRSNRRVDGFTNALKEIGYQGVKAGDLLVHAMDGFAGAIGISDSDGKCSPVCSVCIPWDEKGTHMRYYGYLVRQLAVTDFILSLAKGIRERSTEFRFNEFSGLLLSLPPLTEQAQIAKFLDHETAKIDNLIEKQQQLIELLKEKRQAVISHAVTKGLNPNVPMKDSGVEWLGEVPEHWKLIKFSHCVSIRSGQVDPRKLPYCDYWLIAPNHIVSGEGRIINLETAKDQGADSGKYLCRTGEVIYSKIRPALVKACLSPSDTVLCSADMYPMSSYNGLTNNFLLLYLLSDAFTRFAVNQADRVAMPKINRESLSDCKIPVPPIEEQEKIYSHARKSLEKLDVLLQKSQLTIEFFQERRTALISAAVTGKIDIRDWVAPDTQDVEAPQEATA
ncbi:restriction endonuclease subunit S [Serratia proteamaculans]|uniref:restriction endonuclease subunit S n=1 Tax=Serratia proteamaculans TaxID=28151 RepID=UPI0010CE3C41|nr:restriction endonuclease subunit S [Serratia proteamaculans]RYM56926.1 hypothetical protein BSQ96_00385 [Serratia proteamaculans]